MIVILIIGFQITRFYVVSTGGIYDIESKWRDGGFIFEKRKIN